MPGDLVERFKLLVAANCDQSVSPAARTVLSQILDHYNSRTGQCTPSLERLAQTTGLSRRSVIRGVNELDASGWVRRDHANREGGRSFLSNSFRPAFERIQNGSEVVTGLSPPSDDTVTRDSDSVVTRGSDNPDTDLVTGLSPKPSKRTKESGIKCLSVDPTAFDRFWRAFPKKVGKDAAKPVFERIVRDRKATTEQLVAGAERFAAERAGEDPKFTKHPKTWLNAGSWNDEPASTRPRQTYGREPFNALSRVEDMPDDD